MGLSGITDREYTVMPETISYDSLNKNNRYRKVIFTLAARLPEMLPAASLAQT